MGIKCGDSFTRTSSLQEFLPAVDKLADTSSILGQQFIRLYTMCNQWAIEPKERYQGDFNVKTKNPVLLLHTTYDAELSIRSARNLSATFEGSVLLEINGYGVSDLIFNVVRKEF